MKRYLLVIALIAWPLQPLLAAGGAPHIFSERFKASVNASMNQPDKDQRTRFLVEALRHGSDSEVFHVFPILFRADVLTAAQKAQVCSAEIRASLANVSAFTTSTEPARQTFPHSHAAKIRSDTDRLIVCLDRHYANGKFEFATKPSGRAINSATGKLIVADVKG